MDSEIPAYPFFAKSMAICLPMPRLEPTTIATGFAITNSEIYNVLERANTMQQLQHSWILGLIQCTQYCLDAEVESTEIVDE